jgi:DNA-directed RNA polymerase subunit RPC12/RpoP
MKSELLSQFPALEIEWNVAKNGNIPDSITFHSKIKYYFNCQKCNGKEYYISLKDWFRKKLKISNICRHYPPNQKRKSKVKVSLAQHSPELIKEWSANNCLDYNLVNYGSEQIVEWKCSTCCSLFNQKINKRAAEGVGCPYCASKKVNDVNSLQSSYPELARQLLQPSANKVSVYSSKFGKWKCNNCNETFNRTIFGMVNSYKNNNLGCPFCSGKKTNHNNNLLVTHPEICAEWDFVKNEKGPQNYTAGSGSRYKVWWICSKKKHSWQASINQRTGSENKEGSGCPHCSYRVSRPETKWLDSLGVDEKYRQAKIKINGKKYLVDAYVPEENCIYEFWGDYYHGNPNIYDLNKYNKTCKKLFKDLYQKTINKQETFISNGYKLVSIWESDWKKSIVKK